MAYHVTILRTNASAQIPLDGKKLRALIEQHTDLTWRHVSEDKAEIAPALSSESFKTLHWQDGEIWVANPNANTLRIMLELAEPLNARVRGDEYETYLTPDETYTHPDDALQVARERERVMLLTRNGRIKQWAVQSIIFMVFLLLAWLVYRD
jgi:hypothetical protein